MAVPSAFSAIQILHKTLSEPRTLKEAWLLQRHQMAGITPIFLVLFDSGPLQIGPIIFPLNNESDDNMMNTKNAPSSPLSHAPNSEYLFPDWNMGIPKDILDETDADEK